MIKIIQLLCVLVLVGKSYQWCSMKYNGVDLSDYLEKFRLDNELRNEIYDKSKPYKHNNKLIQKYDYLNYHVRNLGVTENFTVLERMEDIDYNRLTLLSRENKDFPKSVNRFKNVEYLTLVGLNNVNDFYDLKKLKTLVIKDSHIENLDDRISNLTELEYIYIVNSKLRKISNNISKLKKLKIVILDKNYNLDVNIFNNLNNLNNLERFDCDECNLDKIPDVTKLDMLKTLFLQRNNITEISRKIKNVKNLKTLYLNGNKIKETGVELYEYYEVTKIKINGKEYFFI